MTPAHTPARSGAFDSARGEADDRKRRRPIGLALAVAIPLNTYLLTTVAATLLEHTPPASYYQTVAFLIPSLLVTLALQGQFFRIEYLIPPPPRIADHHPRVARMWTRTQRLAAVAMLAYLASGELASLYALAAQDSSPLLFGLTAGAVVTAFIALAIVALIGTPWTR